MILSPSPAPYAALAARIVECRNDLGLSQSAFAAELDLKQQTVSRWEAGTHRPEISQIPPLALLTKDEVSTLMQLAGYGDSVTASLSSLFPVDALDPSTFEQFVADLFVNLESTASVSVQGSRGHTQDGTDILARFPDDRVWSIQCKRVERFGKAEAEKAIAYHTVKAERAFLVVSKIVAPAVLHAVEAHKGWILWDKQQLTRNVRTLPLDTQKRLVDQYFRGQHMALLGVSEPGPWLTADDYFAPFRGRGAVFSHDWSLAGREAEITKLVDCLSQPDMPIVLLSAPGGMGKTRLVKESIHRFAAKKTGVSIHFLSNAREADAASLDALGSRPKILVVDDAHDREGLKLLIEFALIARNQAKLFIATRPYAEQRMRNELALYGQVDPPIIRIGPLDENALRGLIVEVLEQFGGKAEWADAILHFAQDNTLVATMAARVVAREGKIPDLVRGGEMQQIVLSRFTGVVTGHLGSSADAPLLRSVLEVLAVIQPFHIDDRRLADLVALRLPAVLPADVSRALKILSDGGVIYKRGRLFRLMPDLLADFLIEQSCVGHDENLAPFAIEIAEAADGNRLTQILVNLGRLDWRRTDGDPSASALLEPIWQTLQNIEEQYDPRLDAVAAVAVYQPRQALRFVQWQIDHDRIFNGFSNILRRVAFSPDYRDEALRLLWDLGQYDDGDLNRNTSHPIRILSEFIGYTRDKPLDVVEDAAEFGFRLFGEPGAWEGRYTPFDVVGSLLQTEGMTTTSTGRTFSMRPFFIAYDVVAHLRARVINITCELLTAPDRRIAYCASKFLYNALRPPQGVLGSTVSDELLGLYEAEFSTTIARIGVAVAGGALASTTLIGLIRSLEYFAQYDDGPLGDQVRGIFETLPSGLDFRFQAALAEGADYDFTGQVRYGDWGESDAWRTGIVDELLIAYPDRGALVTALLDHVQSLKAVGLTTQPAYFLMEALIAAEPAIAHEIVERARRDPNGPHNDFLGYAVAGVYETDPVEGPDLIRMLIASPESRLSTGGARAMVGIRREPTPGDIDLLREVLRSDNPDVVSIGLTALRSWISLDGQSSVSLAMEVRFDQMPDCLEGVCAALCGRGRSSVGDRLREDQVRLLLSRMAQIPDLSAHWPTTLLAGIAKGYGKPVAQLMLDRTEISLTDEMPRNFHAVAGSRRNRLSLEDATDVADILDFVWRWLRRHDDTSGWERYQIGENISRMFKLDAAPVIEFIDSILERSTAGDLDWIASLLRHSHHTFPFKHRAFVERYLHRCRAVEASLVKTATDQLTAAAVSGGWSGTPGEPMPRDVKARDDARAILGKMSRLSPAYRLYNAILEHAEQNIARSVAEGKVLDDDE